MKHLALLLLALAVVFILALWINRAPAHPLLVQAKGEGRSNLMFVPCPFPEKKLPLPPERNA